MTALFNFDIPSDVYPYTKQSQQSQTGMDWGSDFGQTLSPLLQQSAQQLPGLLSGISPAIQGQYSSLMKQALGPEAFQGTLNQLANKNMLNSSVAGDAMSKTASNIATQVGNQGYNSLLQGLLAQTQLPSQLGNLGQLLQTSQSSGESITEQPLAPYELLAKMLMY